MKKGLKRQFERRDAGNSLRGVEKRDLMKKGLKPFTARLASRDSAAASKNET